MTFSFFQMRIHTISAYFPTKWFDFVVVWKKATPSYNNLKVNSISAICLTKKVNNFFAVRFERLQDTYVVMNGNFHTAPRLRSACLPEKKVRLTTVKQVRESMEMAYFVCVFGRSVFLSDSKFLLVFEYFNFLISIDEDEEFIGRNWRAKYTLGRVHDNEW